MPKVPDGFTVEMVVSGITNPRVIRFAPNGDLFVANSEDGEVLVFDLDEAGGMKEVEPSAYVDKLNQPYGIAFYPADNPEWIYIAESDGMKRYPYKAGDLKAKEGGFGPESETILQGIPAEHHWARPALDRDPSRGPEGSGDRTRRAVPGSLGPAQHHLLRQ